MEEFDDTKGVIKICISKKKRQDNGQKKKNKRTNNDLQKHTHKTKDRVTLSILFVIFVIKEKSRTTNFFHKIS